MILGGRLLTEPYIRATPRCCAKVCVCQKMYYCKIFFCSSHKEWDGNNVKNRSDKSLVDEDGLARAAPAQWRIVWPHQAKCFHGKRILNAPNFISCGALYIWALKGFISKATFFEKDVHYTKHYDVQEFWFLFERISSIFGIFCVCICKYIWMRYHRASNMYSLTHSLWSKFTMTGGEYKNICDTWYKLC